MKGAGPEPIAEEVVRIHEVYHRNGVNEADCISCSSACCSRGGLALLENVILIYKRYRRGLLERSDFSFDGGLSFKSFIIKYFDIYCFRTGGLFRRKSLLLFHTKVLTKRNKLISIPAVAGSFTGRRMEEDSRPERDARGCIFLSSKSPDWPEDDGDSSRKCILHTDKFASHLTAKPIDCVFFTCTSPLNVKVPEKKTARRWITSLANAYPDSLERFGTLVGEFRVDNDSAWF